MKGAKELYKGVLHAEGLGGVQEQGSPFSENGGRARFTVPENGERARMVNREALLSSFNIYLVSCGKGRMEDWIENMFRLYHAGLRLAESFPFS